MRVEDGDGVNRAAAPAAAGLCPGAAAGALCRAGPDTKVRLEEEGRAQGGATCAAAREKDDPSIWQPNQCLRSAEPGLRHSRGGTCISQPDCATEVVA